MSWQDEYKDKLTTNPTIRLENEAYNDITSAIVDVFKIHNQLDNSDCRLVFGIDTIPSSHPIYEKYIIKQTAYPGTYTFEKDGVTVNIKDHLIERSTRVRLFKEGFDYVILFSLR